MVTVEARPSRLTKSQTLWDDVHKDDEARLHSAEYLAQKMGIRVKFCLIKRDREQVKDYLAIYGPVKYKQMWSNISDTTRTNHIGALSIAAVGQDNLFEILDRKLANSGWDEEQQRRIKGTYFSNLARKWQSKADEIRASKDMPDRMKNLSVLINERYAQEYREKASYWLTWEDKSLEVFGLTDYQLVAEEQVDEYLGSSKAS